MIQSVFHSGDLSHHNHKFQFTKKESAESLKSKKRKNVDKAFFFCSDSRRAIRSPATVLIYTLEIVFLNQSLMAFSVNLTHGDTL